MSPSKRKPFIVIDGADGSGKRTQTRLLLQRLRRIGTPVSYVDFPRYGKPSAAFVERYLNGKYGGVNDVGPKAASLFFALDRFEAKKNMEKKLHDGRVLIANRYVTANMGHQTAKIRSKQQREEFLMWLEELEYDILGIPKPTLQIIPSFPAAIAQQLVDKKGERSYTKKKRDIHEADLNHLKAATQAYRELAKRDKTFELIECVKDGSIRSIEDIHEDIWTIVADHLKLPVRVRKQHVTA